MKEISKFIPQISSVCKIYSDVITGNGINREESLALVAFINSFPSIYDAESWIMDLVLNSPHVDIKILLHSLNEDLDKIVILYEKGSSLYNLKDLRCLWTSYITYFKDEIKEQLKRTQEASDNLKEMSNSYEMAEIGGRSPYEVSMLERRVDRLTAEYKDQKDKLEELYAECKNLESEMYSIPRDIFKIIYSKCKSLIPVVEKYYTKPVLAKTTEQTQQTELILSMPVVASIHELCNGNQFEEISPIDFFHILNLHPNIRKTLKVRKNEKARVCYLINQLGKRISPNKKGEWMESMLKTLGITLEYYRSKYREPVSDLPSKKNQEFAEALREVLA